MPWTAIPHLTTALMQQAAEKAKRDRAQVSASDGKVTGLRWRTGYGGSGTFSYVYRPKGGDRK